MFRIFGILCIVGFSGSIDCTTHYRTDLRTYNTHAQCEAAQPAIMEETLKAFEFNNMKWKSFQMGCEEITAEEFKQWERERNTQGNMLDDVI